MAARHEEGCHEKHAASHIFLHGKGISNDSVGVARGAEFREIIRPGAGFKTGDFVEEKFGGGLP